MSREFALGKSGYSVQYNTKLLIQGLILYFLGLLGPALISGVRTGIYAGLSMAMMHDSSAHLLVAALCLVLMNVARMLPHYLGAFLINEGLRVRKEEKRFFFIKIPLTYGLIFLMYVLIDAVYGIHLDFGAPAVFTILFMLILSYMDLFEVGLTSKILLMFSLLMSVQWLDVMPSLTKYGFGRGEISSDIKGIAGFLRMDYTLALFSGCMCFAFLYASALQVRLLYKEHKLRLADEETRRVEKELYQTQIAALKMRSTSEAQSLVHDLKSPLTTVQGLVSLAEMMEENPLIGEYFEKIDTALTGMSSMISEILYEGSRKVITCGDLLNTALAQVSIRIPAEMISCENSCPEAAISGNMIRLSRAVVNLINNSFQAVRPEDGKISVSADRNDGMIRIRIRDNGSGISDKVRGHIFELGYSGRGSTGLGLPFTKQVVENHGGTVTIESREGEYTEAVILLKEVSDGSGKEDPGDR